MEGFDYTLEDFYVEGDRLETGFVTTEILCAAGMRSSCSESTSILRGVVRLVLVRDRDDMVGTVFIRSSAELPQPAIRLQRVQ